MNTDKIYAEMIASEYVTKETSKAKALKKLDNKARVPAQVFTLTFGIIAALIMGVGMCLCMNVIGNGSPFMMVLGIVVGLIGIAIMSINYPIYKIMIEKSKKKYAADILKLAKEISEEE